MLNQGLEYHILVGRPKRKDDAHYVPDILMSFEVCANPGDRLPPGCRIRYSWEHDEKLCTIQVKRTCIDWRGLRRDRGRERAV